MRVAFVTPRYHPCKGGYENYVAALANGLAAGGNTVAVFTTTSLDLEHFWRPNGEHLQPGTEMLGRVQVRRLAVSHRTWRRRALRVLGFAPYWRWQAQYRRPSFPVPGLSQAIEEFRPDLIHIGPLPYSNLMYSGLHAAERSGALLVATPCTHFGVDGTSAVARHYTQAFQIQLLNRCRYVFTLTAVEAARLATLGVQTAKLKTTGIGVELNKVTGGEAARFRRNFGIAGPIVLHMGMKAPEKGTIAVVEAMRLLWREGSSAVLVMAGRGLTSTAEYIRGQGIPKEQLLDLPAIEERDKLDVLAAADVVVQPSAVESFGLLYLEAWANSKPVVAADIAVTREIIEDRREGRLVPFENAPMLAAAIREILIDPNLGRAMGEAGRKKLEAHFTWQPKFEQLKSFILEPSGEI